MSDSLKSRTVRRGILSSPPTGGHKGYLPIVRHILRIYMVVRPKVSGPTMRIRFYFCSTLFFFTDLLYVKLYLVNPIFWSELDLAYPQLYKPFWTQSHHRQLNFKNHRTKFRLPCPVCLAFTPDIHSSSKWMALNS